MIGTEFLQGQGLGNRLFAYITARSIAADKGCVFGTAGQELLQADFLELDKGLKITDTAAFTRYDEKEERLYLPTSAHDMVHGIFVAGADENLHAIKDGTLIYGNLQDESYFAAHKEEIRSWLRVKQDCESYTYTRDNLCILNMRGGEYTDKPELFLRRKYWTDAMGRMRERVPDMQFVIVTDDVPAAKRLYRIPRSRSFRRILPKRSVLSSRPSTGPAITYPAASGPLPRTSMTNSPILTERDSFSPRSSAGKNLQNIPCLRPNRGKRETPMYGRWKRATGGGI